jgi:hypothetical protein
MQKFTLLPSVQGGPFDGSSNKMLDFDIPENHMCDLSQSFVQLECMVQPTGDLAAYVANLCVRNAEAHDITPMNIDLVKNCNLVSAMKGKLEDIRRCDILGHNLAEMSQSSVKKLSTVDSLYQIHANDTDILLSNFVEFHKIGSVPSAYINAHLRIPLSQLVQLGSMTAFDTSKFGRCRLHLELNDLKKLEVYQQLVLDSVGDNSTITAVPANNITSGNTIVITGAYDSLEISPWYVGQRININGITQPATTSALITAATITAIAYAEDTGIITLTTDTPLAALTSPNVYASITVSEFKSANAAPNGTLIILGAKLGLCTVDGAKVETPNELQYLTFTSEEYSVGEQAFMNKVFEIEPECVNTFLLWNNGSVLSTNTDITSYRLRCDNVDLFDRDIFLGYSSGENATTNDPSHYEMLNKTFLNAGIPLKSLVAGNVVRTSIATTTKYAEENNILMICAPVPMTAVSKKFQVNLEAKDTTIGNVILYKQVVKSIKL